MKAVDLKIAQRQGLYVQPLLIKNVEEHPEYWRLLIEFGTHYRISALSGGRCFAESTSYCYLRRANILFDRESLGALAGAIADFEGGAIIISHNMNSFLPCVQKHGLWTQAMKRRVMLNGCLNKTPRSLHKNRSRR